MKRSTTHSAARLRSSRLASMSYRLEITVALLLAIAMGIAVWAANRRPKPIPIDPRSSTFLSGPQGSKGLHEVLVRLKRPSERRRTPLRNLLNDSHRPAILAVVNPPIALEDDEITQVVGFVRGGGAVVAAGNAGGITRCAGWELYPDFIRDDSVAVRAPAGVGIPPSPPSALAGGGTPSQPLARRR